MLFRFVLIALLSSTSYGRDVYPDLAAPSVNSSKLLIAGSDVYNETSAAFDAPNPLLSGPGLGPDLALVFDPEHWYASDIVWQNYVQKGERLMCLLQATDRGAGFLIEDPRTPPSAASRWQGDLRQEIAQWGWHIHGYYDREYECDWEKKGLKEAFDGMGVNAYPAFSEDNEELDGNNDCIAIDHFDRDLLMYDEDVPDVPVKEQRYTVNGREYSATGGYYQFDINKVDGMIVGLDISSPVQAVQEDESWGRPALPGELPELHRLSDIYWGYWFRENPNVKGLHIYGANYIINDATVLLTGRAFRNTNSDDVITWPGKVFSTDTPEGKALLGSPIGATIAHLLIQHKLELGIKYVTEVLVVGRKLDPDKPWEKQDLNLFFMIKDVPVDEVTEDDPGSQQQVVQGQGQEISANASLKSDGGAIVYRRDEGRNMLRVHTLTA